MLEKFVNREYELKILDKRYDAKKPEFLIIYGRRRVGKTELIKRSFEKKKHLYFLGDLRKEEQILKTFSEIVRVSAKKDYLKFDTWDDLFGYIKDSAEKERIIVVFDEVGYINKANRAWYSILQRYWDEHLKNTKIFLILCGSSVSMMEKEVLGYRSPLYGRRTGQIELKPLDYKNVREFFPTRDEKTRIEFYSVLGGIPAYLKQFDEKKDVFENIEKRILCPDEFLYKEPGFILLEELREPTTYFSILTTISQGANKYNEISQNSYVEPNKLSKYLSVLLNLSIVSKTTPIAERKEFRRNTLYSITDNLFNFWFKYVYPHKSLIESGETKHLIHLIKSEFDVYVASAFEDVCKQALKNLSVKKDFPFSIQKVGRWWHKEEEIDIVAVNDDEKAILFGECKWSKKQVKIKTVKELERKSERIEWKRRRKEYFIFFSRNGFEKEAINYAKENKNIYLFDLHDISRTFQ